MLKALSVLRVPSEIHGVNGPDASEGLDANHSVGV